MFELVQNTIKLLEENKDSQLQQEIEKAKEILDENDHVILSRGKDKVTLQIESDTTDTFVEIERGERDLLSSKINGSYKEWNAISIAALYVFQVDLKTEELSEGIKYT